MHRNKLLQLLSDYDPTDSDELDCKRRIIDFVRNNEDCFERSLRIGHVTASSWLLDCSGSRALLTHHAKLDDWFQLGGHCDGDSNVLAVAVKEAQEESGIESIEPMSDKIFDLDVHLIPENSKEPGHYHYDVRFLLQLKAEETVQISSESNALKWVSKDRSSLPTHARSIVRMFDKWVESVQLKALAC